MSFDGKMVKLKGLSEEEVKKISEQFRDKMIPYLQQRREKLFSLKGSPKIQCISAEFGSYTGKDFALYLSKNSDKDELEDIHLDQFFLKIEEILIPKTQNQIQWRSNLLIDKETREVIEIEFIPMAFMGEFLLEILKESKNPPIDSHRLIHSAVMKVGKLIHEVISELGYESTYPREIFDNDELESILQEAMKTDFNIEIRFMAKSLFSQVENELVETYSESDLERKIGIELVKEAIPFIVQYNIRADFPKQTSDEILATPEFIILDPIKPIAIYCDSRRYHDKKKDQILRDRRIDRKLQGMGFIVFRFSQKEIVNNTQACVEEIKSQYLGTEFAQTLTEVYIQKIMSIGVQNTSEWERRFIESLLMKISQDRKIALKEEAILHTIFKKRSVPP